MESEDIQVDTLPIRRVQSMDSEDIQVDTLSISRKQSTERGEGIQVDLVLSVSRVQCMESEDIQVETVPISREQSMESEDIQVDALPISRVQSMESEDIQVDTLSLRMHWPGMEMKMTSSSTRGSSMLQDSRFTSSSFITNLHTPLVRYFFEFRTLSVL
jgi:hypothetical protein